MKLAIVGGGSAGWLTAVYLDKMLNGTGPRKQVPITVIESPKIGRIGVGEATVPTIVRTLQEIGISEETFLETADATFKQAIKFVNWRTTREDHAYYHCFDRFQATGRDNFSLKWALGGRAEPFAYSVSAQPHICDLNLAPKVKGDKEYQGRLPYAYHMDAEKFADYLAKLGAERGVHHIQDTVQDVLLGEKGIKSVVLEQGGEKSFDFFVDCTGFARRLISKLPGFAYRSFSDKLLCDKAVAIQVPYGEHCSGILSSTLSTAVEHGWIWNISLQSRRGFGYVYSSAHCDQDDAEARLRRYIGPAAKDLSARHLGFQSGVLEQPWVANCVAVGLSAGFVEPMESTGIYFVEYAARTFSELFPIFGNNAVLSSRFNSLIHDRYDEVLDFILAHYVLSDRNDTQFWRDARLAERWTPSLSRHFNVWNHKMISASDFANNHQLFGYQNYEYCVYGSDWLPAPVQRQGQPLASQIDPVIKTARDRLADTLPRNDTYFSTKP